MGSATERLRAVGRRLARGPLGRVVDAFPLTVLGAIVLAGGFVALVHYGLRRIDLVLLVVGAVGLGIAVLSCLLTIVAAIGLWLATRRIPEGPPVDVECGRPCGTGFTLPRLWYVPWIDVSWTWLEPEVRVEPRVAGGRMHEEVIALRRGLAHRVVRRLQVADIFGLCKIGLRLTQTRAVRFTPATGALQNLEVIRGMSAGEDISHPDGPAEGGPYDMRRYVAGDPIRYVLWRVFAKSRNLVVRQPERAISPARQTQAYLVTGVGDEAAAGAARVATSSGALGKGWRLGVDGTEDDATSHNAAMDLLVRSAATPSQHGGIGLQAFMQTARGGSMTRTVVFVPGRPGPWLDRIVALGRSHPQALEFAICVDGIDRRGPTGGSTRSWWARPRAPGDLEDAPAPADELAEVVRRLSGTGVKVTVLDRRSGQAFGAAHIERIRAA